MRSIAEHNAGDRVTLALRPEKISLGDDDGVGGRIDEAVYLGTDVSYRIELDGGIAVSVRDQNDVSGQARFAAGDRVRVGLPSGAVRMLLD